MSEKLDGVRGILSGGQSRPRAKAAELESLQRKWMRRSPRDLAKDLTK